MKEKDIYELLKTLELPVAYDHFDDNKNIQPPFIVYRNQAPDTFKADNKTYYKNNNYEIELVTEKKDIAIEKLIEDLLNNNNIPYDSTEPIWDKDEKVYHIFYEI